MEKCPFCSVRLDAGAVECTCCGAKAWLAPTPRFSTPKIVAIVALAIFACLQLRPLIGKFVYLLTGVVAIGLCIWNVKTGKKLRWAIVVPEAWEGRHAASMKMVRRGPAHRRKWIYRVSYDDGQAQDALAHDLDGALNVIRKTVEGGVHTTVTLRCTAADRPATTIPWPIVERLLQR